jgi:hypothetical protein
MENEKKGFEALNSLKASLPPIQTEFKMEILSKEELVERSKVADDRKKLAQTFAEQEIQIRTALRLYKKEVHNWEFLPKDDPVRIEISRLQKRLEELVSIDGDLGEGKEFSMFVIEVGLTDNFQTAMKMLDRAVQEKRIWVPTREEIKETREKNNGKWPEGTLFFDGKVYLQKLETPGARLLNKRLREMCKRAVEDRIARISAAGSHNLLGLCRGRMIPGKYYLFSPWHKDGETGRVRFESHTVVEIYDKNKGEKGARPYLMMRLEDAFGGTSWMLEVKKPFPAFWFEMGKVLAKEDDRRLSSEEKDHIGNVIRVLNGISSAWGRITPASKASKTVSAETPVEIPTAPEVPPISEIEPETPMSAVFDHKIETEEGSEIPVFKKTKTKKAEPAI